MTARDTLMEIVRQWTVRTDGAPETPQAVLDASDAELLRDWAAKIREVGTAKGWSTWAAAFLDPDVEFVDTGMPSTETIVAELRRLDRVAVLREAAEMVDAMADPHCHCGGCDSCAARGYAEQLRRKADEAERGKGTSGGRQPAEGESTPDFFVVGHTYARVGDVLTQFQCKHLDAHPTSGERVAWGWHTDDARQPNWSARKFGQVAFPGWIDVTGGGT